MTHMIFSLLGSGRFNAIRAYSERGVTSSCSSVISSPISGKVLYLHTARSLCTQQRPSGFDLRGLSSIGRRSIFSTNWSFFQSLTRSASNLCRMFGPYGFYDAFSETDNWYPQRYLAIDQGPIAVMIENYRSGLLWKLFMSHPDVQQGLRKLGFQLSSDTPISAS